MQFIKELFLIICKEECFSNITWHRDEHSLKAHASIEITEDGIVIFFKDVHPLKDKQSILVNEEGIVICVSSKHLLNV